MMRKLLLAMVPLAGLALLPGSAMAQAGIAAGAAAGAAVGATVGAALAPPPPEVHTWVVQQKAPSVKVEKDVVVGEALPTTVELHKIPQADKYEFAVVNDKHVVVDPTTRKVVEIYD